MSEQPPIQMNVTQFDKVIRDVVNSGFNSITAGGPMSVADMVFILEAHKLQVIALHTRMLAAAAESPIVGIKGNAAGVFLKGGKG